MPPSRSKAENVMSQAPTDPSLQPLEAFLAQAKEEATSLPDGYRRLEEILMGLETEK